MLMTERKRGPISMKEFNSYIADKNENMDHDKELVGFIRDHKLISSLGLGLQDTNAQSVAEQLFNPFTYTKSNEGIEILANLLLQDEEEDQFWRSTEKALLMACIHLISNFEDENDKNLCSLMDIIGAELEDTDVLKTIFHDMDDSFAGKRWFGVFEKNPKRTQVNIAINAYMRLNHLIYIYETNDVSDKSFPIVRKLFNPLTFTRNMGGLQIMVNLLVPEYRMDKYSQSVRALLSSVISYVSSDEREEELASLDGIAYILQQTFKENDDNLVLSEYEKMLWHLPENAYAKRAYLACRDFTLKDRWNDVCQTCISIIDNLK